MGDMPSFGELTPSALDSLVMFLSDPVAAGRPVGPATKEAALPAAVSSVRTGAPIRYWTGYGLSPAVIDPPWSTITAYDLNAGTIKWRVPLGDAPQAAASFGGHDRGVFMERNGAVVTAGGVLLIATKDEGELRAYDKDTGRVLWSAALPAGSEGVPSVYEVAGREYVVVCAASSKGGAPITESQMAQRVSPATGPITRAYVAFALPTQP
jgi:quinoprotein glucose dehydrogenase